MKKIGNRGDGVQMKESQVVRKRRDKEQRKDDDEEDEERLPRGGKMSRDLLTST